MATTQYIGARYVPLFYENSLGTSEWTANTIYEPLTIVTWNGNSYTSKIPVPANIGRPDQNPTYWVATGIYNSQVNELQQTVDQLIEDLQPITNPRNFIFVGDSYATLQTTGGELLFTALADVLDAESSVQCVKSGIGFTNVNSMGTFLQELQAADIADPDAITDIVVVGGANDYGGIIADIESAIDVFCLYAKATYPNAKIYVAHVGCSRNNRTAIDLRSKASIIAYRHCALYGAVYLNNTEYCLHNRDLLQVDGVHPTAAGVDAVVAAVAEAYTGGSANIRFSEEITPVFNTGQSLYSSPSVSAGTKFMRAELDNGITTISMKGGNVLTLNVSGGSVTSGLVKLYDIDKKLAVGTTDAQYCIECMAQALGSGDSILGTYPCLLYLDDTGNLSIFNRIQFIETNSGVQKIRITLSGSVAIASIDC